MLKKINDVLAGVPATIASGFFLLLDLIPHLMEEFGGAAALPDVLSFDPAWVTVVISGIPMVYLAVWRVIYNPGISKISSALLITIAMFAAIAIGDLFAAGEVAWIMAIVACARQRTVPIPEPTVFKMAPGKGICAEVGDKRLLCGNESYLLHHGVEIGRMIQDSLQELRAQGKAVVLVADGMRCIGVLAMSDVLRPEAQRMVERLHSMGTDIVLLTGDSQQTATYFAHKVGIRQIRAQLLPEEKVSNIVAIQNSGKSVCMIGDGVNDAPALKTANVGVAMGGLGSDIAVDAADIVLMRDDISKLPYLKRLSNATVKTIKFSIGLSMCINLLAVTLSVLGVLNPTTGALVHNAGSCFVVLIAALLYDRKFE